MFFEVFKKLLPTGRAYQFRSVGNGFIQGTTDEFERMLLNVDQFLNGVIPDNPDFNGEWLERYERFYDIPVNPLDSQAVRMARVRARMTPVDPTKSLINRDELQAEIDNAGYAGILYIHENPNGYLPDDIFPPITIGGQLGDYQLDDQQLGGIPVYVDYPEFFSWYQLGDGQCGDFQLGSIPVFNNKIANSLNRHRDTFANLQPLAHTFYVCGPNLGDIVTLPASDEIPLRQLLLTIKPASSIGFLLIKYI